MSTAAFPIDLADVLAARERIAPYINRTPLRRYAELDSAVGSGIRVLVKHENHLPTNSFKVRNGLSAVSVLTQEQRKRGIICGSRGNHGQGVAFAGSQLGIPVTVIVPCGNNPEKNIAMRGFGARVVEFGTNYDEAVAESDRLALSEGLTVIHGTNNRHVLAGAATLTLEVVEQTAELDAMVIAVGGGSQAVGALTVLAAKRPNVEVYAVQASGAPAVYQSWKAGRPVGPIEPITIADGVATAHSYPMTLPSLCAALGGFVAIEEDKVVEATRLMIRTTHNLAEPAGALGLAGLLKLKAALAGKSVCVILSGSNADVPLLRRIWMSQPGE